MLLPRSSVEVNVTKIKTIKNLIIFWLSFADEINYIFKVVALPSFIYLFISNYFEIKMYLIFFEIRTYLTNLYNFYEYLMYVGLT